MPYIADGVLPDLFDVDRLDEVFRRITLRCGDFLKDRVAEYTPVAEDPFGERKRPPGTLKRSWEIGKVKLEGNVYFIEVTTDDEVAPFVEWDTRPHVIRARRAMSLRFRDRRGKVVYAYSVRHPGTRGSRMMGRALADLRQEWPRIAREELARDRG